jgi:hypothetical protein
VQRSGEIEPSVTWARLARDVDGRRIVVVDTEEAPDPAEWRGSGGGRCRRPWLVEWEIVSKEDVGRD